MAIHIDLQSSDKIRKHIGKLYGEYRITKSSTVMVLINEWKSKYIEKINKEKSKNKNISVLNK